MNEQISISRRGKQVQLRSHFSSTQDLIIFLNRGVNEQFDFKSTRLVPKNGDATAGDVIHETGDDCTPWFLNGTYIGGNHGAAVVIELTAPKHGKTTLDFGSRWHDRDDRTFCLIKVESVDKLWFLAENTAALPDWRFAIKLPVGSLKRGSEQLLFQKAEITQLRPALRITRQDYLVDGKRPIADGDTSQGRFFELREESEIINPGAVAEKILRNRGKECNWTSSELPALLKQTIIYRFYPNGSTVIDHHAETIQPFVFGHMGFVQSHQLVRGHFQTHELYVPKTLPPTANNQISHFSWIADFSGRQEQPLVFGVEERNILNPENLPDRFIQLLGIRKAGITTRKVGFALGYSPLWRKSQTDFRSAVAGFIHTSKKTYPRAMAGTPDAVVKPGTMFHCVAYRVYFDAEKYRPASCVYWFKESGSIVLYADYLNETTSHTLDLPVDLKSRKFRIIEKSDSVDVRSADLASSGNPTVSTSAPGYLLLRFE